MWYKFVCSKGTSVLGSGDHGVASHPGDSQDDRLPGPSPDERVLPPVRDQSGARLSDPGWKDAQGQPLPPRRGDARLQSTEGKVIAAERRRAGEAADRRGRRSRAPGSGRGGVAMSSIGGSGRGGSTRRSPPARGTPSAEMNCGRRTRGSPRTPGTGGPRARPTSRRLLRRDSRGGGPRPHADPRRDPGREESSRGRDDPPGLAARRPRASSKAMKSTRPGVFECRLDAVARYVFLGRRSTPGGLSIDHGIRNRQHLEHALLPEHGPVERRRPRPDGFPPNIIIIPATSRGSGRSSGKYSAAQRETPPVRARISQRRDDARPAGGHASGDPRRGQGRDDRRFRREILEADLEGRPPAGRVRRRRLLPPGRHGRPRDGEYRAASSNRATSSRSTRSSACPRSASISATKMSSW